MKINKYIRKSESHQLDLSVESSGMTLIVKAGDFVVRGEPYSLEADEEFQVPERDLDAHLVGYLVKTKDGAVRLFVDEQVPPYPPYTFAEQDDLTSLRQLFNLTVPAGTTSLDDLEMLLNQYELPAEETETSNAEGE